MDLKELELGVNPKIHWYYQSKKIPMFRFITEVHKRLNKKITLIDVGSGSGFFMYEAYEAIPEMIEKIYLVDIGYSDEEIQPTKGKLIEKTKSLPDKIQDAVVVMMDVLEHLESDDDMLKEIKKRSTGDNFYFITVPAFKSLWSGHDVYLGHYRRYIIKTLRGLLNRQGFGISNCYYIYGSIFPFVWLVRRIDNKESMPKTSLKPSGNLVNSMLRFYNKLEIRTGKWNKIFGVTCVAEGKI